MSNTMRNPLLQQAEDKIETGLTPETQANYMKIVVAGMHAALDKGENGILASLKQSPDPIADAAKGAVSLVMILRKEAHGVMPLKALVPAAMTLMLKALDFADRSSIVKVGTNDLVRATHVFTDFLFARLGITKQALANAANRVHQITQDPDAMAAINLKAGITRHPLAATLTPLPGAPGLINGMEAHATGGLVERVDPEPKDFRARLPKQTYGDRLLQIDPGEASADRNLVDPASAYREMNELPGEYAKGGTINALRGPNPRGPDEGYITAKSGEFVIQKSAVEKYGRAAMEALNKGAIDPKTLIAAIGKKKN